MKLQKKYLVEGHWYDNKNKKASFYTFSTSKKKAIESVNQQFTGGFISKKAKIIKL